MADTVNFFNQSCKTNQNQDSNPKTETKTKIEWVNKVERTHQHIIGHFGDESLESITCNGTDNVTRSTNRETECKETQNNAT